MPIAVVTGAARGIGAAIAGRLASDGYELVGLDLQDGPGVTACDVTDERRVASLAADVGPVDVLVNNAGVWTFGPIENTDTARFRRTLEVNLVGAFICTRSFGASMLDRGGSIVNVVSIAASAASPGVEGYSPSKAALVAFTRQTALEWGRRGVRVNAVGPGLIPTPGAGDVYEDELVRRVRADAVPLGRLGTPDDIAAVVSFLAGTDASYVTGQVIYVDGGLTNALMTVIPRPDQIPGPHLGT